MNSDSTTVEINQNDASCFLHLHINPIGRLSAPQRNNDNNSQKLSYRRRPLCRFSSTITVGTPLSTVETTSLRPLGEADSKVFEIYGPSVVILKHPHKYRSLDRRRYTSLISSSRLFDINDLVTLSEILSITFNP